VRAHWFALPLLRLLDGEGLVEVRLEEGRFHLHAGAGEGPVYGDGPAPGEPDALLVLDTATCTALSRGELDLARAVREGRVEVTGAGALAKALREAGQEARAQRAS
jgi:putative sterol carrier protein